MMENNNQPNGRLLKQEKFDISDSAFACVMFILLSIAFSICLTVFNVRVVMSSFSYFVLHAIVEGLFAIAAVLVAKIKKKSLLDGACMRKKVSGGIAGWCFLLAYVSLLGFGNLTNVFIEILEYFGFSSDGASLEITNFWQYLGSVITSCLVAGFCEELLFRGVIQSGFKKWGIKVSVGFSALIFMLMHGSALQTVHQLIIGIIIGYIFYKTNNLWIGVLVHIFNNFIPITQVYLLNILSAETVQEVATEAATIEPVTMGGIFIDAIIALVIAWAGYYFTNIIIKKIIKANDKLNEKTSNLTETTIVVDGENQEIEMRVDGNVVTDNKTQEQSRENPKISAGTIAMFSIAGLYLILEWILNTVSMFK